MVVEVGGGGGGRWRIRRKGRGSVLSHNEFVFQSTAATGAPLVNPASFCTMVDVPELWVPAGRGVAQQRISHSEWLTKLVITLLSSGGVMDEVLTLVKSVCRVKVREHWCN